MTTDNSKATQCDRIAQRLREVGVVDNFWAIENKVSYRLGARIFDLKEQGWEFETKKVGKNFYYKAVRDPEKQPKQLSLETVNA